MHLTRLWRSTGFRLAALYAGIFGASVLILFAVIYWIAGSALHQQLTANVEGEVAALVNDYQTGGAGHAAESISHRIASRTHATLYYLLLDPAGRKLAGDLPTVPPRSGWMDLPAARDKDDDRDEDAEDVTEHRVLALGTMLADGSFLLVGEDTHRVVEVEEAIIQAFGWAFAITILLAASGGAVLSFGFLRRIDAINRTSRAIIDGRLSDRVPTRGTDDEFDRLAHNLNEMLDRVQALMESLRQVSNDIAHDLRTPLSRLRQQLETARVTSGRIEDYESAVNQAIVDTDAILVTFSALLRIAQIEAGTRKAAFTTIDLSGIFRSISEIYGAVAEDHGQSLVATIEPDISVRGDRELLTQLLANLVENAIRHTPKGTQISLHLGRGPRGPFGVVADNGPGIPSGARERVFQRFFRLEQSRTTPGSGLGLSLAAAVAEIHGITITLGDNNPGLKVTLDFSRDV